MIVASFGRGANHALGRIVKARTSQGCAVGGGAGLRYSC
jgi:hypothetical protein